MNGKLKLFEQVNIVLSGFFSEQESCVERYVIHCLKQYKHIYGLSVLNFILICFICSAKWNTIRFNDSISRLTANKESKITNEIHSLHLQAIQHTMITDANFSFISKFFKCLLVCTVKESFVTPLLLKSSMTMTSSRRSAGVRWMTEWIVRRSADNASPSWKVIMTDVLGSGPSEKKFVDAQLKRFRYTCIDGWKAKDHAAFSSLTIRVN